MAGGPVRVKASRFVLCYRRMSFVRCYHRETQECVVDTHDGEFFSSFGGNCVREIYDNMTTAATIGFQVTSVPPVRPGRVDIDSAGIAFPFSPLTLVNTAMAALYPVGLAVRNRLRVPPSWGCGRRSRFRGHGSRTCPACGDGKQVAAPTQTKGAAEAAPSRIR